MKIRFYNHWHTGDVFHAKGYLQDLQRQRPDIEWTYAHVNHPKLMQDIAKFDTMPDITDNLKGFVDSDNVLNINTWIGAYGWEVMPRGEDHANWPSIHRMFAQIYAELAAAGIAVTFDMANTYRYMPTTDFSKFDIAAANAFLDATDGRSRVLFCNGLVRSAQSQLGLMEHVIETLAQEFPDHVFIATARFDTLLDNIHFTADIFDLDNDVNEIAYLSTHSNIIVGKNSGPFMYTHIQDNFWSADTTFLSLSHRPSDCYPCHWAWPTDACRYIHHSSDDQSRITEILREVMKNPGQSQGCVELTD